MCGEQGPEIWAAMLRTGSPPRVRGTVVAVGGRWAIARITPACAGNSVLSMVVLLWLEDHPRVCGEQTIRYNWLYPDNGSPPRVRGTGNFAGFGAGGNGITPACAGNSNGLDDGRLIGGDHPRVCGEQQLKFHIYFREQGSPPRVRGTGCCSRPMESRIGITPACAGNR